MSLRGGAKRQRNNLHLNGQLLSIRHSRLAEIASPIRARNDIYSGVGVRVSVGTAVGSEVDVNVVVACGVAVGVEVDAVDSVVDVAVAVEASSETTIIT